MRASCLPVAWAVVAVVAATMVMAATTPNVGLNTTQVPTTPSSVDNAESTDSDAEQGVFAALITLTALAATVSNLVGVLVLWLWQDQRLQRGRLLLHLTAANAVYAATWVVYGISHFNDPNFLTRNGSKGNCALVGFNYGALMYSTVYEIGLLIVAHYYITNQSRVPYRAERTMHLFCWLVLLASTVPTWALCRGKCSECDTIVCDGECHDFYRQGLFGFLALLAAATLLSLALYVRMRSVRASIDQQRCNVQLAEHTSKKKRALRLKVLEMKAMLVKQMVEPLYWYPYVFVIMAIVSSIIAGVSDADRRSFETDTWRRLILRLVWWLLALRPLVHTVVFFLEQDHRSRLSIAAIRERLSRPSSRARFMGTRVLMYTVDNESRAPTPLPSVMQHQRLGQHTPPPNAQLLPPFASDSGEERLGKRRDRCIFLCETDDETSTRHAKHESAASTQACTRSIPLCELQCHRLGASHICTHPNVEQLGALLVGCSIQQFLSFSSISDPKYSLPSHS
eukprot:m.117547 g.117547  ORF g.117547 m.117547 type:complete len:511 (-) comp16402_c3_seq2:53-1585(-)